MRKNKVYLDTSIINFLYTDDAPDFCRVTQDFFENYSQRYELYASDIVLLEISRDKDELHRQKLQDVLKAYPVTILNSDSEEIRRLALAYTERGVIPVAKIEDALHVAIAAYYEMDILLSWNFKHIANIRKETRILSVNTEQGYRYPLRLVSPLEVEDEE